ncbi:MAG: response regulator [Phormidesmis sp.]
MNILLVEDDYLLGRGTARLLEKLGEHRVRLTHKAADVFRICESGGTDLVIMDINLPGTIWQGKEVTGVDLSRMLKSHETTAHLPIVLLTGHATQADRIRFLSEALADELWTKPIDDYAAFLTVLANVYAGHSAHGLSGHGFKASAS